MQMFRHAPAVKAAAPQSQSKARATITFSGACSVDQTITIIDTNGLSKIYTAKGSTTAGSLQFINTDAVAAAAALKTCIENAAGHPSTITVGLHSDGTGIGKNRLTLTQVVVGSAGNTTITENLDNVTVTNFLYGSDNGNNFYRATAGGKYGLYNYDMNNPRSMSPYSPVYALTPSTSLTVPVAHGPLITGALTSDFLSTRKETNAKAKAVITITDYSELNNGDIASLISTGTTTHNFTIGAQNPGSKTWALTFTNSTGAYNNDPTITIDSTTLLQIGMNVSGTGIPTGATVSSITNATTFELSAATTGGSLSSQTLTFTSNEIAADNLAACITHQSDFIAESIGNEVHVTQSVAGSAGNTAITLTDSGTVGMTKSNFVGGILYSLKEDGLSESVGRIVMSDNTLNHFRSDAPRRVTEVETDKQDRPDYSVNARYSQLLYLKETKRVY